MSGTHTAPSGPPAVPGAALRGEIRRLAVPLSVEGLVSVLAQTLIVTALGRAGDTELYLRSLYVPVAFGFAAVCEGIGIATQVATAQAHGRGDRSEVRRNGAGFLLLGGALMALAVLGLTMSTPLVADAMQVTAGQRGRFEEFLRWTALANLARVPPVVATAMLRGHGRAAAATLSTVVGAATEVGVVYGLGDQAGHGVFSLPWAILVGSVVSAGCAAAWVRRGGLSPVGPRPAVRRPLRLLTDVGLPVAASYGLLSGFNLAALWVLAPLGKYAQAGYSTAYTVQTLVIVPTIALGSATAIVMNRRIGRGEHRGLTPVFGAGLRLTALWYTVVALALWAGAGPLAHGITGSRTVAPWTERYLELVGPTLPLMCLVLVALTVLEQLRQGLLAFTLNVVYFAGVVLLGNALVAPGRDPDTFFRVIAAANVTAGPAVVALAVWRIRRLSRKGGTDADAGTGRDDRPVHLSGGRTEPTGGAAGAVEP